MATLIGYRRAGYIYKPSEEDEKLFTAIAGLIRKQAGAFADAGVYLDKHYSTAAMAKRCTRKPGPNGKREPWGVWKRFKSAIEDTLDGMPFDSLDEPLEVARRIVLMTWLLTDKKAHTFTPLFTEFQKIGWGGADDQMVIDFGPASMLYAQHEHYPSRYVWQVIAFGRDDDWVKRGAGQPSRWLLLAHDAWRVLEREGVTEPPSKDQEAHKTGYSELPKRAKIAWDQYQQACELLDKDNPNDSDAYDAFKRMCEEKKERVRLPAFLTWRRYLSEARRLAGQSKHTARRARLSDTGSSIVLANQV